MKTKTDLKQVARLVAGILALVFTVGGALYLFAVVQEKALYSPLSEDTWEKISQVCLVFLFPLFLVISAIFIFVFAFFASKKRRMINFFTSFIDLAYISASWYYIVDSEKYFTHYVFILLSLLYSFISIFSYKKGIYKATRVISIVGLALSIYAAWLLIESKDLWLSNYTWTAYFVPSTVLVPLAYAIVHCITKPEADNAAKEPKKELQR